MERNFLIKRESNGLINIEKYPDRGGEPSDRNSYLKSSFQPHLVAFEDKEDAVDFLTTHFKEDMLHMNVLNYYKMPKGYYF